MAALYLLGLVTLVVGYIFIHFKYLRPTKIATPPTFTSWEETFRQSNATEFMLKPGTHQEKDTRNGS